MLGCNHILGSFYDILGTCHILVVPRKKWNLNFLELTIRGKKIRQPRLNAELGLHSWVLTEILFAVQNFTPGFKFSQNYLICKQDMMKGHFMLISQNAPGIAIKHPFL